MIYLDSAATTLQKPPAVARSAAWAVGHLATRPGVCDFWAYGVCLDLFPVAQYRNGF